MGLRTVAPGGGGAGFGGLAHLPPLTSAPPRVMSLTVLCWYSRSSSATISFGSWALIQARPFLRGLPVVGSLPMFVPR